MKNKVLGMVMLAAMTGMLAVGCGSKANETEATTTSTEATTDAETVAPATEATEVLETEVLTDALETEEVLEDGTDVVIEDGAETEAPTEEAAE